MYYLNILLGSHDEVWLAFPNIYLMEEENKKDGQENFSNNRSKISASKMSCLNYKCRLKEVHYLRVI
jgi:hypothetical protein